MSPLQGPHFLAQNSKARSLVIFLHGFGADGQDLIGLAPLFAQQLPHTAFHSPDGPQPCEISPFGRQWFSLAQYDPDYLRREPATQAEAFEAMSPGAKEAAPLLDAYIHALINHYGLTPERVALVGFSQGTMMALHTGLRQETPFAAIVGFSGALVGSSTLQKELSSPCPVMLIHGEVDDMLPVHAVELAQTSLQKVGITPQVIKRPGLPHAIDETGAQQAAFFLKQQLILT